MNIADAFDVIMAGTRPSVIHPDQWRDASDLLMEHGLGVSYSSTHERFFLVDLATQWSTDIPDGYRVEPIGSAKQLHFEWDMRECDNPLGTPLLIGAQILS